MGPDEPEIDALTREDLLGVEFAATDGVDVGGGAQVFADRKHLVLGLQGVVDVEGG